MKLLITFSVLLLISGMVMAADSVSLKAAESKQEAFIPSAHIDEKIALLSERICMSFLVDGKQIATKVKSLIIGHMQKYEGIKQPTPEQIIHFLNRNKNYMTCGDDNKNYMMAAFDHGRAYYQLLEKLFIYDLYPEDESFFININAVSYHSGKPQTVLDYMYREYGNSVRGPKMRKEIKSLIDTFEQYLGGKKYADLSAEEKALAAEQVPRPH